MADEVHLPVLHVKAKQEIGIMMGFIAIFALVIAAYGIFMRGKDKIQAKHEEERKRELVERGYGLKNHGSGAAREKNKSVDGGAEQRIETIRE